MAGGTFTTQNKVRPGFYVNFKTEGGSISALGERGVVALGLELSWGAPKEIIEVEAGEDTFEKLGYTITDEKLLLVHEALKRAQKLLLYRLNTGTKASVTVGTSITATAKYGGVRGNDITIVVEQNVDDGSKYDVKTLVDGKEVDLQTIASVEDLENNPWVDFSGTGTPDTTAGSPLIGGDDGSATNQDHADFLAAVELHDFQTVALNSTDDTLKGTYTSFAQRLRDSEGKKIQVILENYSTADYEGVINVKNGVVLADGTKLTAAQATAWVAGATAGANVNESLTYTAYDGAIDANPRFTHSQIVTALQNGEFVFTHRDGKAIVEQDINSFTSFTPEKSKYFSKNRVIRVLDSIGNDLKAIFDNFFAGKISNNADGQNLFKKEIIKYLENLQEIDAVQNFDAQNDVTVKSGTDIDSVVANVAIQPVDSIEKIYMTVEIF